MAYGDPYVTLAEMKRRMNIQGTADDAAVQAALDGACAAIDAYCSRQFNTAGAGEIRYFDTCDRDVLEVPFGIVSLSAVAIDDGTFTYPTAWPPAAWELRPLNPKPGHPHTELRRVMYAGYGWWIGDRRVRLTGQFGFAAVPGAVKQACYLIAHRQYERWKAPFGVVGGGDLGTGPVAIPGVDRDVRQLLAGYRARPAI